MKKLAAAFVCLTLFVTLPLGPWQHVHEHGHDAHHQDGALHAHQAAHPSAPVWRTHGPDEDARAVQDASGALARDASHLVVAVVDSVMRVDASTCGAAPHGLDLTLGHDPPPRDPVAPRGPPAPPASSLA